MELTDTIVAPATPPGEGGLGIVRLSGADSARFLERVFPSRPPSQMQTHRLYHGAVRRMDGSLVDDAMVVLMHGPHSYTGEDVVEVHCHGGRLIIQALLDLFLDLGARLARPGEFTLRAFMNGRLDLAQAEAVINVIGARSEQACRVALGQLEGRLSRRLYWYAEQLKAALALVEAHIDFPDDEVGALDFNGLGKDLAVLQQDMAGLVDSFDSGRMLREGLNLLILGRPNVGKSSLMNALLGESRAIVTAVPGTTRDTLEEQLVLGGFPVRLVDTAGVRETVDPVEREGVKRARDKAASADLVLLVVDGSAMETEEDRLAATLCQPDRTVLVVNKGDQPQCPKRPLSPQFPNQVMVSAKLETGLDGLQAAIMAALTGGSSTERGEDLVLTERRHREALVRSLEALRRFDLAVEGVAPLECLALELRDALHAVGQVTGETTPDEILDQIFSRFCIGK